jgi:hypothetical protein
LVCGVVEIEIVKALFQERDGYRCLLAWRLIALANASQEHANLWVAGWKLEASGEEEMANATQRGSDGGALNWHAGTESVCACVHDEVGDDSNLLLLR